MPATPLRRLPCALIATALLFLPLDSAAQANLRGRWSSKSSAGVCWGLVNSYGFCEGSEPVHMVLTRGYSGGHHSQLLWYEGHQHSGGTWEGGLWGWTPPSTTSQQSCSAYPASFFTDIDLSSPGYNIFCSSHSVLPDGKVLVSGGTVGGEGGSKQSALFNPAANSWTLQGTMEHWRWYPTNTALPDGKVLVSSGSMYLDVQQFGGRAGPAGSDLLHADSLEKLALTSPPFWEIPAAKKQGYPTSGWPAPRDGHSAVWMRDFTGAWMVFGGRDQDGTSLRNDVYQMHRNFDNDHYETYSATFHEGGTTRPEERFRHAAVVAGDDAQTMLVFGGRVQSGSVQNDLWEFYRNAQGAWRWREPSGVSGTPPSARQGHTSIWDPEQRNVLVFGGADASDTPIDARMYKLHVPLTGAMAWDTVFVEPDTLTGRSPTARHGHVMVYDPAEYHPGSQGAPDNDYEYRATLWGGHGGAAGLCSPDTLWILWIPEEGSGKNYRWQQVIPSGTKPSARYRLAADVEKGIQLVVTGGDVGGSASAEAWSLPLDKLARRDLAHSWTRLADNRKGPVTGHTLVAGGSKWARKQERFDPGTGNYSPVGTVKRQDWYPFQFLMPQADSTRIFFAGPSDTTWLLNLTGTPAWRWNPTLVPTVLPYLGFRSGSAVMYLPGKIMRVGSRDTDPQNATARGATMTIDLTDLPDTSQWVVRDSMILGRVNFKKVVVLAGGVD